MRRYIGATQTGVVIINSSTDKDVLGVGTDGLKTCLGIVMYGENGYISLIHYDQTIGNDELQKQFAKVPGLYKWEIWVNEPFVDKGEPSKVRVEKLLGIMQQFALKIDHDLCSIQNDAFYIKRNGEGVAGVPQTILYCDTKYDREKGLGPRHITNMLNHIHGDKSIDEQYDGNDFTHLKLQPYVSLITPDVAFKTTGISRDEWQKYADGYVTCKVAEKGLSITNLGKSPSAREVAKATRETQEVLEFMKSIKKTQEDIREVHLKLQIDLESTQCDDHVPAAASSDPNLAGALPHATMDDDVPADN